MNTLPAPLYGDVIVLSTRLIEQCLTSPPTQYRSYGIRFYRSKDPTNSIKVLLKKHKNTSAHTYKKNSKTLVCTNMGWLGDGSHRGQVRHAWTAVVLPSRSPLNTSTHDGLRPCWLSAVLGHGTVEAQAHSYSQTTIPTVTQSLQQCTVTVRVTVVRIMEHATARYVPGCTVNRGSQQEVYCHSLHPAGSKALLVYLDTPG